MNQVSRRNKTNDGKKSRFALNIQKYLKYYLEKEGRQKVLNT